MPANLLEIDYLNKSEFPLWDEFVKTSTQGTFFCSTKWMQILENVYHRTLKILICQKNEKIVAGIPFFENKKLFWSLITPVFLMPYDGPLFCSNTEAKPQKLIADQLNFLEELIRQLQKDYKLVTLKTHQSINDLRAFKWNNFKIEAEHTYICKLDNEQIIANRFNQSLRKKIQKSKELNYRLIQSKEINVFLDLFFSSYERHGYVPPVSNEKIRLLLQNIIQLSNVRLYFVEKDNQVLAGRIIVEDENTIYDLLAGSNDEKGLASSFLVAEIMKQYAGKFAYFDFMGADHPEIEKFKRAFGGKLEHRFKVQYNNGLMLNMILKIREKSNIRKRIL